MKWILLFFVISWSLQAQKFPSIGIVSDFQNDSLVHGAGFEGMVESVARTISPRGVSSDQLTAELTQWGTLRIPLVAFNIFLPPNLKVVGNQVREKEIMIYAREVFKRCQLAHVKMIVWGSAGSRRIPERFNRIRAREQFISMAGKLAALAQSYDITLALENLNRTETNFINTVREALDIVKAVNHPNFRLCADLYHMLKEGESPSVLLSCKDYLVHCDLAERDQRTPPGTKGDDFGPYLQALHQIGYTGWIVMECQWLDLKAEAAPAAIFLRSQIQKAYQQ